jgi:hypothetical protein
MVSRLPMSTHARTRQGLEDKLNHGAYEQRYGSKHHTKKHKAPYLLRVGKLPKCQKRKNDGNGPCQRASHAIRNVAYLGYHDADASGPLTGIC